MYNTIKLLRKITIMPEGELKFNIAMIDFATGEEVPNVTPDNIKALGIEQFTPTGDQQKDSLKQVQINKEIEEKRDEFPRFTFGDVLNQLFDSIAMPSNSDFEVYANTLRDIRIARSRKENGIKVVIADLEKLKRLFSKPPKEFLNKKCAFLTECLDAAIISPIVKSTT